MAYTELGDDSKVKLKIPTKGTTNWDEELKTNTFQKIVDHDHTGVDGKGSKITTAAITDANVTNEKLAGDSVTQDKIADDAIQIEHKKTIDQTLESGAATTLTGVTVTNDQAIKLNYRIHNTGTATSVQIGTLTGQAGDYLVDEFVGTDIGAIFSWSGNNLQLTGALNDKITYSIEFLE